MGGAGCVGEGSFVLHCQICHGDGLGGEVELPPPQQLPVLHEAVRVLGAVGVGLGELLGATVELLILLVIFFEVRVVGPGKLDFPLHLGNPA